MPLSVGIMVSIKLGKPYKEISMKLFQHAQKPLTEDDNTSLETLYEEYRIDHLPKDVKRLAIAHAVDQYEAEPSIIETCTSEVKRRSLRS